MRLQAPSSWAVASAAGPSACEGLATAPGAVVVAGRGGGGVTGDAGAPAAGVAALLCARFGVVSGVAGCTTTCVTAMPAAAAAGALGGDTTPWLVRDGGAARETGAAAEVAELLALAVVAAEPGRGVREGTVPMQEKSISTDRREGTYCLWEGQASRGQVVRTEWFRPPQAAGAQGAAYEILTFAISRRRRDAIKGILSWY